MVCFSRLILKGARALIFVLSGCLKLRMSELNTSPSDFIIQARAKVLEHLEDESFGVSELAEALNMSRSNLLRRIKKDTELSASQFIRKVRLEQSRELLKNGESNVSEVAYAVGFASVSYFIKCFREEYGYPPGKIGQQESSEAQLDESYQKTTPAPEAPKAPTPSKWVYLLATLLLISLVVVFFPWGDELSAKAEGEKSIAVLPFLNESSDSSNLYFVNGLMESTLNNLQRIEDLRVTSRTSSEKFRNSKQSIPEIAEELKVRYLIEGSGQKIGNQIKLHIQLIDALEDKPLWTEEYHREWGDIFDLQEEIAEQISKSIKVLISPQARAQIAKRPTQNLKAYDYYLKALDPYFERSPESLKLAISLFDSAITEDPKFALAYADMAIAYYLLDLNHKEKSYTEQINKFSDQALLYDSKSDVSLIAKACYYLQVADYRLALPHLEKALEYNPNSVAAIHMLSDYYAYHDPNTGKYLEYALKGVRLDAIGRDSITSSYSYLQLSNALVQAGFFKEALHYVNRSLAYYPKNYYSPHLKIFVQVSIDNDWSAASTKLQKLWYTDTSRMDILQDLAKVYYAKEQFDSAYFYFKKLVQYREGAGLDLYLHENAKIAHVYGMMGHPAKADSLFADYVEYCEKTPSKYQSAHLAVREAYKGDTDQAIKYLKEFSQEDHFQSWFLLLEQEPLIKQLHSHPHFDAVFQKIKDQFWRDHREIKKRLEAMALL